MVSYLFSRNAFVLRIEINEKMLEMVSKMATADVSSSIILGL